jgi:Cu+-exporting ATPase
MRERNIALADNVEKAQVLASEAKTPMYFAVKNQFSYCKVNVCPRSING